MTRRPIFSDKRRNPSVWVDPRLVIGVLLITASVIGVYVIISMNDHRIPVYVARVPLSVGETVNPQDLITLSIAFDGASEHYLVPGKPLDEDLVVRRAVTE
jgi:hypothetical protein